MCGYVHATAEMWRPEDDCQASGLSFHHQVLGSELGSSDLVAGVLIHLTSLNHNVKGVLVGELGKDRSINEECKRN